MTDIDTESKLRRGLAQYAEAMAVTPPPLEDLLEPPTSRRHPLVLAGVGLTAAAAAVAVAGVVLTRDDPPSVSTTPAIDTTAAPGPCEPRQAAGVAIARGALPDDRPWAVEVRGTPPGIRTWAVIDGEPGPGVEHNVWSWSGLVNEGMLSWTLAVFEGGRIVHGEVPPSAAGVEVRLAGGHTVSLCPVRVPGLQAVRFAAAALPPGPDVVEIVVLDAEGRTIAGGDVSEMLPPSPGDGGYGFSLDVDDQLVELPLGGVTAPDPASTPTEAVVSGELPSGPWSVRTGLVGDPSDANYVLEIVPSDPENGLTRADTADAFLQDPEWHLTPIDGRLVAWGATPVDVAEVVVTTDGGPQVSIATQPSGIDGFDVRVFGDDLPEGALPTAIEGRAADGTVVFRVADVAGQLGAVDDRLPAATVSLSVDSVDAGD